MTSLSGSISRAPHGDALGLHELLLAEQHVELAHQLLDVLALLVLQAAIGLHPVLGGVARRLDAGGEFLLRLQDAVLAAAGLHGPAQQRRLLAVELLLLEIVHVVVEQVEGGLVLAGPELVGGLALGFQALLPHHLEQGRLPLLVLVDQVGVAGSDGRAPVGGHGLARHLGACQHRGGAGALDAAQPVHERTDRLHPRLLDRADEAGQVVDLAEAGLARRVEQLAVDGRQQGGGGGHVAAAQGGLRGVESFAGLEALLVVLFHVDGAEQGLGLLLHAVLEVEGLLSHPAGGARLALLQFDARLGQQLLPVRRGGKVAGLPHAAGQGCRHGLELGQLVVDGAGVLEESGGEGAGFLPLGCCRPAASRNVALGEVDGVARLAGQLLHLAAGVGRHLLAHEIGMGLVRSERDLERLRLHRLLAGGEQVALAVQALGLSHELAGAQLVGIGGGRRHDAGHGHVRAGIGPRRGHGGLERRQGRLAPGHRGGRQFGAAAAGLGRLAVGGAACWGGRPCPTRRRRCRASASGRPACWLRRGRPWRAWRGLQRAA